MLETYQWVLLGVFATVVIVGIIQNYRDQEDGWLYVPDHVDFMSYYTDAETGSEDYTVVDVYQRVEGNFLQGLYFDENIRQLYESAGLYGESHVQLLEPTDPTTMSLFSDDLLTASETPHLKQSGTHVVLEPSKVREMGSSYFAEGLAARSASEFACLTWKEKKIFIYDRATLTKLDSLNLDTDYTDEGWGLTSDEDTTYNGYYTMYASDGTSYIRKLDGYDMTVRSSIYVRDPNNGNAAVENINELEWANGFIYANIWLTDNIVKIDPSTGNVIKTWDMSTLEVAERAFQKDWKDKYTGDTINGIAYDAANDQFFVTGKKYHLVFKVTLN